MSEIKLLQCPFCGGEAEATFIADGGYNTIRCKTHNCIIKECIPYMYRSKEEAIEKWNTRKPMQEIVERLEEYPHGKYTDDYGKGFSVAMNIAIDIVKEEGGMNG